nr:hypothetical protein [Tanacetum cinerariifolium]
MGEPLSPDRIFDFLKDELEPHLTYDFFAPAPLPGYTGNPIKKNGWLEADDYLLGELEAIMDEQMVVPAIEEVVEPVVEGEEEQELAVLFGEDDDSEDFDEEEAWEVNEECLMAPVTPPSMPARQPPSVYEVRGPSTVVAEGPFFPYLAPRLSVPPFVIEDLSPRLGYLEYGHGQLVHRINQVSDADIAASVTIAELAPRIYAVDRQVQVMASQMVHVADRWDQVGAQVEQGQLTAAQRDETVTELTQQMQALQIDKQQRYTQIQQLQTTVTEMGNRESTLMRCILGLKQWIVALERRPPGPQ